MLALAPPARPPAGALLLLFAAFALLLPARSADALPAAAYEIDEISVPGKTSTSVVAVDHAGRALVYWVVFSHNPFPAQPTIEDFGYVIWENGTLTPLEIPGLTGVNRIGMNVAGVVWGNSDDGPFVYSNGDVTIVESPDFEATAIRGVDAAGRVYGVLGEYGEPRLFDVFPPVVVDSTFVWEKGTFSELNLLLDYGELRGVLQDGLLWGESFDRGFLQQGSNLTVVKVPGSSTFISGVTEDHEVWGGINGGISIGGLSFNRFFWDPIDGFDVRPCCRLPGTLLAPVAMGEAGVFWGPAWTATNTAVIATPVPEPRMVLLQLGLGIGLALVRRSRSD